MSLIFCDDIIFLVFALSLILCILIIALLQNSEDGKLSTSQLRLAYSTLVRSATMTANGVPDDTYTLAWYCIQLLVDTIRDLSPLTYTSQNPKGKGKAPQEKLVKVDNNTMKTEDRTHRLSLMLISTVSSLPMSMMLRALDEVCVIISAYSSYSSSSQDDSKDEEGSQSERKRRRKKELLEALFSEILEKIGDCEKEAAMKWWYRYRPVLMSESSGHVVDGGGEQGQGPLGTKLLLASSSWFTKRWRGVEKVKNLDAAGEREKNQSSPNPSILSRL